MKDRHTVGKRGEKDMFALTNTGHTEGDTSISTRVDVVQGIWVETGSYQFEQGGQRATGQ